MNFEDTRDWVSEVTREVVEEIKVKIKVVRVSKCSVCGGLYHNARRHKIDETKNPQQ